jgi:glutamate dehydrogenase
MTDQERSRADARVERFTAEGAPEDLARDTAALMPLVAALDVADMAERASWPVGPASRVFRTVAARFGLDRLRGAAMAFTLGAHWDRLALRRTLEELYEDQRLLAEAVTRHAGAPPKGAAASFARQAVDAWVEANAERTQMLSGAMADLEATGAWTFAKTILAAAEVRALSSATG